MPRTNSPPKYRKHRASGQAIVTLTDPSGKKRDYYLGKHGSAESKAEYARLIGEWIVAAKSIPSVGPDRTDLTVNELIARFWTHAQAYYRDQDGQPAGELVNYRYSLKPLKKTYGHTLASEFGPLALKAVRQTMIEAGLSRPVVNRRTSRIKQLFKWAVAEQIVPASVHQALLAVAGLHIGRTEAPEPAPILPVADDVVEKTLPKLSRFVRGIVRLMRVTGMRPGEACQLRRCEIDAMGDVWTYRPARHKTAHRGKTRVVSIGPRAQQILAEFPTDEPTDYVFSPGRARAERFAAMRAARLTRVQPSQVSRAKDQPRRRPGARYTAKSVARAVTVAAGKAGVESWHPNQLRHARGTEVRKAFGLEGAQVALGHANAKITETYAERDQDLAARIALATG